MFEDEPANVAKDPVAIIVERWMNVREDTGKNDGVAVAHFLRGDVGLPWCAAMLLRAIEHSHWPKPPSSVEARLRHGDRWAWYYENRSVEAWEKNLASDGRTILPADAARNDLVFYGDRAGSDEESATERRKPQRHVDIVESTTVDPDGTLLLNVIGGNLGNAVKRRIVAINDKRITSICRLPRE